MNRELGAVDQRAQSVPDERPARMAEAGAEQMGCMASLWGGQDESGKMVVPNFLSFLRLNLEHARGGGRSAYQDAPYLGLLAGACG